MIMSTARDFIEPSKTGQYLPLIHKLIEETRKEHGNISYVLYSDNDNEGEYVLIEEWEDKISLQKHFESPHFTSIVPEIKKLQKKPSEVNLYTKAY